MSSMKRASTLLISLLAAASLAAGCGGDDDDDSNGDVSTGIAANKLLSDVTTEEAATACENLQEGFRERLSPDTLIRSLCTVISAAFADTPADCEDLRDSCIEEANDPSSDEGVDADTISFDCDGGAALSECTSTVGELETCFNDMLDHITSAFSGITCADAASLEMEDVDAFQESTLTLPASCENIDCGEDSPFGPGE